jgi:hypothetical protein
MELKQILMMLVMAGILGGYWWFKVGRHGGTAGYMNKKLGLREGEQISAMWMSYVDIDRSTADKVGEVLLNVRTRGINLMVALTSSGRLVIGDNENDNPPLGFQRGEVVVSDYPKAGDHKTLAGPNGLEKTCVMLLTPSYGNPLRLELVRSGFEAVSAWSLRA